MAKKGQYQSVATTKVPNWFKKESLRLRKLGAHGWTYEIMQCDKPWVYGL